MEYVNVANIIEQERKKRQAQIFKGVDTNIIDHIEKAHEAEFQKGYTEELPENLQRFSSDIESFNKAETEFLLSKIQGELNANFNNPLLKSMKTIALNHLNTEIEKAKYQVGQPHPNNPNILWTEWQPGKFDWKSKNGRYWKGKTGGSAKNQTSTPAPRKPGSTDEIERMTAAGVRSSILGLNNIATNVKDNGDHFKIDFDANDFNTNGKRSPQIDRIAKFLESMGASCVIGSNSIKAYKKVEAKKNTTSKTQSPQDKVKDVMQQFDDTTMDEDEFDEYVDSVLGNDMGQKLRKQILESNKSFSDKKQAYKDAVEMHLGLKPQKYSDMDIKDAKKALVGKVVTLSDYWPDGRGGSQDAIGEIKNVRLYGKNKTPIAEVTYPNGDEQLIRLDEIDDGKMKDSYKTPVTIGDDKKKLDAIKNKIASTK